MMNKAQAQLLKNHLDYSLDGYLTRGSWIDSHKNGNQVEFDGIPAWRYSAYVADQQTAQSSARELNEVFAITGAYDKKIYAQSYHQAAGTFAGAYKIEVFCWM